MYVEQSTVHKVSDIVVAHSAGIEREKTTYSFYIDFKYMNIPIL